MKRLIAFTMLLLLITGCSSAEDASKVKENDIPTNEKAGLSSNDSSNSQNAAGNDTDLANQMLEQADESGSIKRIEGTKYVMSKDRTESVKNEDGTVGLLTEETDEELTFSITKKTEIQVCFYDPETYNSRLAKGSQKDIQEGSGVSLYGSQTGNQFVATKVIVLKVNQ